MADDRSASRGERPRAEPEIILPGEPLRSSRSNDFTDAPFGRRMYVARLGPFGLFLIALAIGAVSVGLIILILGTILIWIPMIGLIVAAAMISALFRSRFRRGG